MGRKSLTKTAEAFLENKFSVKQKMKKRDNKKNVEGKKERKMIFVEFDGEKRKKK